MKEIRIGIIGTGIIAQTHLDYYSAIPGVRVVALCDLQGGKLEETAQKYNVKFTYTDYRKLLARDDLDAVDVCLHNNLHAPIAIDVMKSGKDCYCEKPMAGAYRDAKAMYDASEILGRKLHIQLGFLYGFEALTARRLIAEGKLGRVYHARSIGYRRRGRPYVDGYGEKEFDTKYMAGGGALFDMGVYHISQILYLLGLPKIERISGQIYQEVEIPERIRALSHFDVEELGVGFVKCENNLTIDVLESWAIHMGEFEPSFIAGDKGGIQLNPLKYFTSMDGITAEATFDTEADSYREHRHDPKLAAFDNSQAHWIAVLRGETEQIPTPRIALQTMLLSEGIYLSGKLGREVTAEEVEAMSESMAIHHQDTEFGGLDYPACPFL